MQSVLAIQDIRKRISIRHSDAARYSPPDQFPTAAASAVTPAWAHNSLGWAYRDLGILHTLLDEAPVSQEFFTKASHHFERAARLSLLAGSQDVTTDYDSYVSAVRMAVICGARERVISLSEPSLTPAPAKLIVVRRVTEEETLALQAIISLLAGRDAPAEQYAERLAMIPVKKLTFPSRSDALLSLLSKNSASFVSALTLMLDKQHRHATNRRSFDYACPSSHICQEAVELAMLALWRGLVQVSDLPERRGLLSLQTIRTGNKLPPPDGTVVELNLDYLPHAYLSHVMSATSKIQ